MFITTVLLPDFSHILDIASEEIIGFFKIAPSLIGASKRS